jgi:hypothetical protein
VYLIDRALDGRELGDVAGRQQIDANDGDTIGELFDIFPGTSQPVKMVQVGQRAEKGS